MSNKKFAIISSIELDNQLNINESIIENFDIFIMSYKDHEPIKNKYYYANKIIPLDFSLPGMKYLNIYKNFNFDTFKNYEGIYIPDDDTCINFDELLIFLQIMQKNNIDLAQFSLSNDSYYSHYITKNEINNFYRITNFVEVMSPIFSKDGFKILYETFKMNQTSWGLDYLWAHLFSKQSKKIAICDKFQMKHLRKPMSNYGSEMYKSAKNDLEKIIKEYNLNTTHQTFEIIL